MKYIWKPFKKEALSTLWYAAKMVCICLVTWMLLIIFSNGHDFIPIRIFGIFMTGIVSIWAVCDLHHKRPRH